MDQNSKQGGFVYLEDFAEAKCNYVHDGVIEHDFNFGANFILKRLRDALEKGEQITMKWCAEPIPIRRQGSILAMHDYLDGAENILKRIEMFVAHGGKIDINTWLMCDVGKFLYKEEGS